MAELFGFEIKRKTQEPVSFAPPQNDDGAVVVAEGGVYGTFVDLDGSVRTEAELVSKYREISYHPELETAIDEIVNEVITQEPESKLVEIVLDELKQPDRIKAQVVEEFENVLKLLEFNSLSYEIFKRWYVDGRLYYHAITDPKNPAAGIIEMRYIDPRKMKKVRELKKKQIGQAAEAQRTAQEYFIYSDKGFAKTSGSGAVPSQGVSGIKIAKDSIVYCTSGLTSPSGDLVLSYLHKAIKPLNQLRAMEDSLVIYRISRAPERRIFYIDVGNLPKMKAEQYLRDIMTKFKNKIVYDSNTGEIKDSRKYMSMLEDFWLPRREGGKGTEITTLPGGQNLGQLEDVEYFQRNLYQALNVPISRLDPNSQYGIGRTTEISREEIKFAKFVSRLRNKFASLFTKTLERQLILKGIIRPEEWDSFKDAFKYKFAVDNYWSELKETEVLNNRAALVETMRPLIGTYYSNDFVRRTILKQTDDQIRENDQKILEELKNPIFNPPEPVDPAQGAG